MKMKGSIHKEAEESGDSSIRVVEEKIIPEIFQEFYDLMEASDGAVVLKEFKDIVSKLVSLAKMGSIEAYREIEKIISGGNLDPREIDFARVALHHCRFRMENDLFDIETDMISGGLGGKGNRLRYYIALTCQEGSLADHIHQIKKTFSDILSKGDSVLEELQYHGFYVSLVILGSLDFAIGNMVDEALCECTFLSPVYYLTNREIPTEDRIKDWLNGKLDDEK